MPERVYQYILEFVGAQSSIPIATLAGPDNEARRPRQRLKALENLRSARLVTDQEYQGAEAANPGRPVAG